MAELEAIVAVLAGGAGARLGGAKPIAQLAGAPLISHTVTAARASGLETVVIAKRAVELPKLECEVVYDPSASRHPLCGVLTALDRAAARSSDTGAVVVGCDMPFLTGALLRWLAGGAPARAQPGSGRAASGEADGRDHPPPVGSRALALVASIGGCPQPLLARYLPDHRPALGRALAAGLSMRAAVRGLSVRPLAERELRAFGEPERLCFNVNSREDLRLAEGLLLARGRV